MRWMYHKINFWVFLLSLAPFLLIHSAHAKRPAPPEVAPVRDQGVEYRVDHWKWVDGVHWEYVEAWGLKNNKLLWGLKIYEAVPEEFKDSKDAEVYITSLQVEGDRLIITNERKERYEVDLKTRKVIKK